MLLVRHNDCLCAIAVLCRSLLLDVSACPDPNFAFVLQVDLSRYVAELLPLLISELRHADEKRRANAVTAVKIAFRVCVD